MPRCACALVHRCTTSSISSAASRRIDPRAGAVDRPGARSGSTVDLGGLAGDAEAVAAVDHGLARPQAGEHLAAVASVREQLEHQRAGDALAAVRRQHPDARHGRRRQAGTAGYDRVDRVAAGMADAPPAVPRRQRVDLLPARHATSPSLVVAGGESSAEPIAARRPVLVGLRSCRISITATMLTRARGGHVAV